MMRIALICVCVIAAASADEAALRFFLASRTTTLTSFSSTTTTTQSVTVKTDCFSITGLTTCARRRRLVEDDGVSQAAEIKPEESPTQDAAAPSIESSHDEVSILGLGNDCYSGRNLDLASARFITLLFSTTSVGVSTSSTTTTVTSKNTIRPLCTTVGASYPAC